MAWGFDNYLGLCEQGHPVRGQNPANLSRFNVLKGGLLATYGKMNAAFERIVGVSNVKTKLGRAEEKEVRAIMLALDRRIRDFRVKAIATAARYGGTAVARHLAAAPTLSVPLLGEGVEGALVFVDAYEACTFMVEFGPEVAAIGADILEVAARIGIKTITGF